MAIFGKENVIDMVRFQKLPYWKIAETANSKSAGNFVAKFESEVDNPSLDESLNLLRQALNRLTPGQYFFVATPKENSYKNNIDCTIVIENSNSPAQIAGIVNSGLNKPLYLDGIGEVTPENFSDAIAKKFSLMQKELEEKQKRQQLEEENKRLKKELEEKESGINGGLLSIATMFWPTLKKTPAALEIMKVVSGGMKPQQNTVPTAQTLSGTETTTENTEQRIQSALSGLLGDDPENPAAQQKLADDLELLAKVKRENPDVYDMGLDYLTNM